MRRRLFDGLDQGLGEEIQAVEGLSAPNRQRGFCSLVVTLQLALQAAGQPISYAELMARTGAAFMLRFSDDFSPDLPLQGREAHAVEALQELGWQANLLEHPTPDTVLSTVRTETAAGRPACALGWGSNPTEWSLIAGLQATDLLGHGFGGTGRLERKPPAVLLLLVLGEPTSPVGRGLRPAPDATSSVGRGLVPRRVVSCAVTLLRSNVPHYQQWLDLLDQPEPYGPPLSQLERFHGEQRLSEALADARDAAAQFLAASVADFPAEAEDDIAQAADVAERLAEDAEKLLVPPDIIQSAHLPEDLDWRHDRRELLRGMMELEETLARLLRRSLWLAGAETEAGE